MVWIVLLIAAAVGVLLFMKKPAAIGKAGGKVGRMDRIDSFKPRTVMTASELAMYHRLSEALPDHIILSQVGYAAFLKPAGNDRTLRNHIDRKLMDFVVLTRTGEFVAAIELDGSSHDNDRAAAEDAFKTALLKATGLRLVRWRAESLPKGAEIRTALVG